MVEALWEQIRSLLGVGADAEQLGAVQIALRTVVVYASALVLVRVASKRFLSEATALT